MIKLFDYQLDAIHSWISNQYQGIFEMATGTGKTFTALGCVQKLLEDHPSLITIISCPYIHLCDQWMDSINQYGLAYERVIKSNSANKSWKSDLANHLADLSSYPFHLIIVTTHDTLSSADFVQLLSESPTKKLIIADEMHGLGSYKRKGGLLEDYPYRLGLSATPTRYFDEIGTDTIFKYFDHVVFSFGLREALNNINETTGYPFLTPYAYLPNFTQLNGDELEEYIQISKSIVYLLSKKDDLYNEKMMEQLLFKRANIIKNATNKYDLLEKLLDKLGSDVSDLIIYCSPQQIEIVGNILYRRHIKMKRFTMEEGTTKKKEFGYLNEREYIIKQFSEGACQVLLAMKCLDEGVDIPSAKIGILMSSCGNPREYIQRLGRILRYHPSKTDAQIYDFIIEPSIRYFDPTIREFEIKIFKKEAERYDFIAQNAKNSAEVSRLIYHKVDEILGG